MGNSVSVAVSNVSTTSLYAVGTLHNNKYTYGSTRFTLSCNGVDFVDWSTSIPYGQDVSWAGWYNYGSSTSARTFSVKAWWDSSGFGYVDNNSATVNVNIPAAAPAVTTPPAITNASLALNTSTNVLTGSWTTNGSGSSNPTNVIVDVGVDDTWTQDYNGDKKNSHTFDGEDNHKYQFRMSSGNSAGRSATVYTNIKYTKPASPTVKNAVVTNTPGGVATLQFNIDTSAVNYPSSDKFEWRYKYGGTYYGPSGSTTSWFNSTTKNINISSADSGVDSTLASRLKACKDGANTIAIQARVYNADNSLSNQSADSIANNNTIKQIYINIPEGKSLKAVYLNMPDGWTPPQVKDDLAFIKAVTGKTPDVSSAGKIKGFKITSNALVWTPEEAPTSVKSFTTNSAKKAFNSPTVTIDATSFSGTVAAYVSKGNNISRGYIGPTQTFEDVTINSVNDGITSKTLTFDEVSIEEGDTCMFAVLASSAKEFTVSFSCITKDIVTY